MTSGLTDGVRRNEPSAGKLSALTGLILFSFALGSVHAFSIFLPALEKNFGASRMAASLTYSLALASLALGVLIGHRFYWRVAPAGYVAATGLVAAFGCLLAGLAGSVAIVWFGYGIVFGGANGLGYGYALQFSAQLMPDRKGLAMGSINAAYAFGAISFPFPLMAALDKGGWAAALWVLSFAILAFAAAGSVLLARSRMVYTHSLAHAPSTKDAGWRTIASWWSAYCCAVMAGLMVMGQATGIAQAAGASERLIVASPAVIAAASMLGSILCGAWLEKMRDLAVMASLAILTATALIAMAALPLIAVTITGLAAVGFAYGGTISVFPASLSRTFGSAAGARLYGRVFTGWAIAGLLGPGIAGWLYDLQQNYIMALTVAAAIAAFSPFLLLRPCRL